MGVSSKAQNLDSASAEETSDLGEPSVTAVGEPSIIKVTAPEITRGSVLAGRYQVEAVIGRGGSGIVLRAYDRVAQMAVAVKLLKPELAGDPKWIERFSRELRLARRIQHPNVCRVFDIFQADGHWFITMELAPGGTLRDQLGEKAKERSLDQKIADVRAVVAGLAAIHQAGIVHRDVKPDNFLRMDEGRLVLSDFGLATNPTEASTVSIMVGTPSYMAPEVVMGQQATSQSDVWSLGVVLHELIFGMRPEWTRGVAGSFIVRKPALTLGAKERALVAFIEECLHTDPLIRPENAVAAQVQCDRVLTGKALSPSRRRSRHPRWIWAVIAAILAAGAGISSGQWWRRASAFTVSPTAPAPSFRGDAQDWTKTTNVVASLDGHLHCMAWTVPDRVLEVVVGAPRRAFDVDVSNGKLTVSTLPERAISVGCPQRSKRGELLFESFDEVGRSQIMLARSPSDVSDAKVVTPGSEPLWLGSGDEFIYTVDDSHAGLFSLPVMTTSIVTEAPEDRGLLVGKSVSDDGRSFALRFYDLNRKRHVVVHEVPSLAVSHRATFDELVWNVAFISGSERLAFSTSSSRGDVLAELDFRSNEVLRLGGIPGRDVAKVLPDGRRWAFAAFRVTSDVWRVEGGVRTTRLTTDGQSYNPSVSPHGDLIVERRMLDGRSHIRLYSPAGEPRDVSPGTMDVTPSFLPDGSGWLYVDGERRTIRRCSMTDRCQDVVRPGDFPLLPIASADGDRIAYITAVDRELLKVVDRDRKVRELGPARSGCRPFWTSDNHLWVVQGTDARPIWAELDSETGERIRTVPINGTLNHELNGCGVHAAPPGVSQLVSAWSSEDSEIRLVSR